ncbi:MAG: hypothetical protein WD768_18090 [Phycisphaeraceae bacterium]
MGFLGRDSASDLRRIERWRQWAHARTPYALISPALGLLAIVDCWTLILGVAAGIAAIVTGIVGLRDLKERTNLIGKHLCFTGITLGILGLIASFAMWLWVFPMLAKRAAAGG